MMSDTTKRWMEAAKILIQAPSAQVRCPIRDDGVLNVTDHVFADDNTLMERHLVCEHCGAKNVIRMRVPV